MITKNPFGRFRLCHLFVLAVLLSQIAWAQDTDTNSDSAENDSPHASSSKPDSPDSDEAQTPQSEKSDKPENSDGLNQSDESNKSNSTESESVKNALPDRNSAELEDTLSKINSTTGTESEELLLDFLRSLSEEERNNLRKDPTLSWLKDPQLKELTRNFLDPPSKTMTVSDVARELERLGNEVLKNPKDPKAINRLAKLYAEGVYRRNLETPGIDSSVVPFLDDFTKKIRQAGEESYGGSTLERAWEHALSKAMNDLATSSSDEVLNGVFKNYSQWARQNDMGESLPMLAGVTRIEPSWDFAGQTLESMGLVAAAAAKLQAGKELTSEEENLLRDSLSKWADHPYVKLRPNENNEPSLRTQGNQVLKWGKVFSIELMRELERTPGLQEFLPSSLKEEGAFKTLQTAMEKSLLGNFKTFFGGTTEDGVGGSNDHSAMAFAMLNSLNPKDQGDFMNRLNELLDSKGSKPGLFPYAPFRNLPINASYRDSAGRAVALALAQFQSNPNEENMQKALDGLEQFNDFSGSLRAHVTRSGAHSESGADTLAPYYWSPNLFSAGRLVSEMGRAVQQNPNSFSEESKSRLTRGIDFLEKSVLSTWNPDTQSFAHMGKETYQQLGPPAVTAPSLTTLRHIGLARSYLGNHGVPSPETPLPLEELTKAGLIRPELPPVQPPPAQEANRIQLTPARPTPQRPTPAQKLLWRALF